MEGQTGHCKELGKCGERGGGVWEEPVVEGWEAARSRGKVKQQGRTVRPLLLSKDRPRAVTSNSLH